VKRCYYRVLLYNILYNRKNEDINVSKRERRMKNERVQITLPLDAHENLRRTVWIFLVKLPLLLVSFFVFSTVYVLSDMHSSRVPVPVHSYYDTRMVYTRLVYESSLQEVGSWTKVWHRLWLLRRWGRRVLVLSLLALLHTTVLLVAQKSCTVQSYVHQGRYRCVLMWSIFLPSTWQ
jgi:hypothetical protein